jgi:hypothetical protein
MHSKIKLGIALFVLGFIGILSLLTVDLPMDKIPKEVLAQFSPTILKVLTLINPLVLLALLTTLGVVLYDKVHLRVPTISRLLSITDTDDIRFTNQLMYGTIAGALAGAVIVLISFLFKDFLPTELTTLSEKIKPTLAARFLYGGITEEILMRFGLMTVFVWLMFKLFKSLQPLTYWLGIAGAALLFGAGHLPVVFSAVAEPTLILIVYIVLANSLAGFAFGWLYWKKGLEAAFIGHIAAHITMLGGEFVFN